MEKSIDVNSLMRDEKVKSISGNGDSMMETILALKDLLGSHSRLSLLPSKTSSVPFELHLDERYVTVLEKSGQDEVVYHFDFESHTLYKNKKPNNTPDLFSEFGALLSTIILAISNKQLVFKYSE